MQSRSRRAIKNKAKQNTAITVSIDRSVDGIVLSSLARDKAVGLHAWNHVLHTRRKFAVVRCYYTDSGGKTHRIAAQKSSNMSNPCFSSKPRSGKHPDQTHNRYRRMRLGRVNDGQHTEQTVHRASCLRYRAATTSDHMRAASCPQDSRDFFTSTKFIVRLETLPIMDKHDSSNTVCTASHENIKTTHKMSRTKLRQRAKKGAKHNKQNV